MDSAQSQNSGDFFTAGVGHAAPDAASLGRYDLNSNTWGQNAPNGGLREPVNPARVGQMALQNYAGLPSYSQGTVVQPGIPRVADFGPANVVPGMPEGGKEVPQFLGHQSVATFATENGPGIRQGSEALTQEMSGNVSSNMAPEVAVPEVPLKSAVIQTEGDRISRGAVSEIRKLEQGLGNGVPVADFYDQIRNLMEENLRRSFNREVGNE